MATRTEVSESEKVRAEAGGALGARIYRFLSTVPTWILWLVVVIWSIPSLGLFVNSFRTRDAQQATPFWAIGGDTGNGFGAPSLDNYDEVLFGGNPLFDNLLNSLAIVIPATVIPIAIAAFAAYAFAWIEFKGREWIFIITISLLAIPLQTSLIPLLRLYATGGQWTIPFFDKTMRLFPDFDLAGTVTAVWLTHTGFALPFAIFLLHNYISGLPKDVFESAFIDGADHFKIFWRLVVPLSTPVLAAFTIFQFLWTWNDYLIALTMIGSGTDALPITVALASIAGEFGQREHLLSAAAFISTALPLVVFFALQRYFVRGVLAGSVKG
ncbi:MAG: carbohydrate ABC transporter permease [Acidimicrobiia bacterium]